MAKGDIKYLITANADGMIKDTKKVDDAIEGVKTQAGKTKSALSGMFKQFAVGLVGVLAVKKAFKEVVGFMKDSVAAAIEQERVEAALNAVLESTGFAAGLTAEELKKMSSELQKVTTYGDEAILSGQNILLTFKNIGEDVFPRATESMLDISTAMGIDLKSSAIQVGKALNDPLTGLTMLTRVGITFTDSQKEMIKELATSGRLMEAQGIILTELESQFGGAARAAAETFGGSITQLKNVFGDLQEEVGTAITESEDFKQLIADAKETIVDLIESGKVTEWAKDAAEGIGFMIEALGALLETLGSLKTGGYIQWVGDMADKITGIEDEMKNLETEGRKSATEFIKSLDNIDLTLEEVRIEIEKGPESWKLYTDEMKRQDEVLGRLNELDKEHADMVAEMNTAATDAAGAEDELNQKVETQIILLDTWYPKGKRMVDVIKDINTYVGESAVPAMNDLSGVVYNTQTEFKNAYEFGVDPWRTGTKEAIGDVETRSIDFTDGLRTRWATAWSDILENFKGFKTDFTGLLDVLKKQVLDIFGSILADVTTSFIKPLTDEVSKALGGVVSGATSTATGGGGGGIGGLISGGLGASPAGALATGLGAAAGTLLGSLLGPKGPSARSTDLTKDNTWTSAQHLGNIAIINDDIKWAIRGDMIPILDEIKLAAWDRNELMRGGAGFAPSAASTSVSLNPNFSVHMKAATVMLDNRINIDGREVMRAMSKYSVKFSKSRQIQWHENAITSG